MKWTLFHCHLNIGKQPSKEADGTLGRKIQDEGIELPPWSPHKAVRLGWK